VNDSPILVFLLALALLVCATTITYAEGEGKMIPVGDPFVDFDLPAHDDTVVRSADLAGKPFLLFFYPKADTPG
jgi:cytochrome oxidase Cu insertion factor (SCO1/SenC/PrrC family)